MIKGAIIGAIAAAIAVLLIALLQPRRKCPDCGEPFPKLRKPANKRQALWGGSSCAECGCEVDRKGRKVST